MRTTPTVLESHRNWDLRYGTSRCHHLLVNLRPDGCSVKREGLIGWSPIVTLESQPPSMWSPGVVA